MLYFGFVVYLSCSPKFLPETIQFLMLKLPSNLWKRVLIHLIYEVAVEELSIFHIDEFHGSDIYQGQNSKFLRKRGTVSVVGATRSHLFQHRKVQDPREIYCCRQM